MTISDNEAASRAYKLHHRHTPVVFAFFMALIMAFLMCCVIVSANAGLTADLHLRVLKAYAVAMPAAFVCILFVRPVVMRIVSLLVHPPVAG